MNGIPPVEPTSKSPRGARLAWAAAALVALSAIPALAEENLELALNVGEHHTLEIPDLKQWTLVGRDVIEARASEGRVELVGLNPGTTSLLIWRQSGERLRVQVLVSPDQNAEATEAVIEGNELVLGVGSIRELAIPDVTGFSVKGDRDLVEVQLIGDRVRITGVTEGRLTVILRRRAGTFRVQVVVRTV